MKRLTFIIAALAATQLSLAQQTAGADIYFNLSDFGDTLTVTPFSHAEGHWGEPQVFILKDGVGQLRLPLESAATVRFAKGLPPKGVVDHAMGFWSIVVPGRPLQITGTTARFHLSGDKVYEDYGKLTRLMNNDVQKEAMRVYSEMRKDSLLRDSAQAIYERTIANWMVSRSGDLRRFIEADRTSEAIVAFLGALTIDDFMTLEPGFPQTLTDGVFTVMYEPTRKRYHRNAQVERNTEGTREGAPAPAFTLPDAEGKAYTFNPKGGRYVLLDFWGSWCGWCIKGFPQMKEFYGRYKDCIEFIGVDCYDKADKWQAALAEHALPWPQVKSEDDSRDVPNVAVLYAVNSFPTKILISPDGKIVKRFVGESPEMYQYLESAF